jgi:hypothetical protein
MYSLRMSPGQVPERTSSARPRRRATATYRASRMAAVALMVMEVETRSSGIPSRRTSMSSRLSMATPTRPTSPAAWGSSES